MPRSPGISISEDVRAQLLAALRRIGELEAEFLTTTTQAEKLFAEGRAVEGPLRGR